MKEVWVLGTRLPHRSVHDFAIPFKGLSQALDLPQSHFGVYFSACCTSLGSRKAKSVQFFVVDYVPDW